MAKIYDIDFRTGSLVNKITGDVGINQNGIIARSEKGMAWKANGNDSSVIYSNKTVLVGDFTIELYVKFNKYNDYVYAFYNCANGGAQHGWWIEFGSQRGFTMYSNEELVLEDNIVDIRTLKLNTWHLFLITRNGSGTNNVKGYLNGILIGQGTYIQNLGDGLYVDRIGTCFESIAGINSYMLNGDVARLTMYNNAFTEAERAAALRDFNNSYPIDSCKTPDFTSLKPTDLSREVNNTLEEVGILANLNGITAGHYAHGNNTVTQDGTSIKSTHVDDVNGTYHYFGAIPINLTLTPVIGDKYLITFKAKVNTGSVTIVFSNVSNSPDSIVVTNTEWQTFTRELVASSTTMVMSISNMGAGEIAWHEFISFKLKRGLVAAYNMIPNGSVLTDISGNSKVATLSGNPISVKQGMKFDGADDKAVMGNIGNVKSVSFRIKPYATTCKILEGAANSILIHINAGTLTSTDFATKYINGVTGTAMVADQWQTVTLTSATDVAMSAVSLALNNTTYGKFEIEDLRFYSTTLTESQAKAYHNSFVHPVLKVDFADEGADGIAKVPEGWVKQSGSFAVKELPKLTGENFGEISTGGWIQTVGVAFTQDNKIHFNIPVGDMSIYKSNLITGKVYKYSFDITSIDGGNVWVESSVSTKFTTLGRHEIITVANNTNLAIVGTNTIATIENLSVVEVTLPTLKNGSKFLECLTAGVIAIPSKQAYGTWEWDWYKGGAANEIYVYISDPKNKRNTGAYDFVADGSELLYMNRTAELNLLYTAASYISINIWYRTKITRSISGVFTLFIKGGAFIPTVGYDGWTLVSMSGGAGTNPVTDNTYTTSEYFVLDLGAGDRIANIVLTDGIKEL